MKRGSITLLTRTFLAVVACLALLTMNARAQDDDPPSQAGRLSIVNGNVSIQPAGTQDWSQADLNYPIGPGDRIFTDTDGRAEIQVGRTYVRIGPNSDVTFVDFSSAAITFGAAQGALHLRSRGLWQGQSLYVQTPSGTSTATGPADFRVDVYPDQQTAIFTTFDGGLYISGANDFGMEEQPGQALQLVGTNPVYPQWLQPAGPDDLDNWSQRRDAQIARATSYQYVSPDAPGAEELDAYGQWQPGTEYGDMWFPAVQPGWAPYHNGHWVNREPWGWVWVEDEPWGYAPFHYGRWVNYHNRWGWIPGPREEHPVWSPALVVFAGGGAVGGGGLSIWFPLGPGEPYRPWYPCSPRYVDRVNITNIRETNIVHVQKTYVNVVNVTNVTNITYVNRTTGATAMRQQDFAAGRPVAQASVRVDPRQVQQAQVLAKPQVAPTHEAMISRPPAKPVPVAVARPVMINAKGLAVAAQPKAQPVAPPVKTAPPPPAISNRVVVAPPQNVKMTPTARQALQTAPRPVQQPARPGQPTGQGQPTGAGPAPGRPVTPPTPGRPATPPAQGQQPAPIPGNQPRPAPIPTPGTRPPAQPVPQEPSRPGERPVTPNPPNQPGPPPRNESRPAPNPQPAQPPRPTYQPPPPPPQRPSERPAPNQPPVSAPPHSNERPAPRQEPATPPRQAERPAPYQQPAPPPRQAERPAPPPQAQPRPEAPPPHTAPPPRPNAEPAPRQQPPPPPEKNRRPDDKDKKPQN
jgi:hypothetical protein